MEKTSLIEWRKKNRLTQEAAATSFEVKLDTWRKWEQGKNPIPKMLAVCISAYSGQYHYVYKITHKETGLYYFGVRSCIKNIDRDPYKGSGVWAKKMKRIGAPLKKDIIAIFPSRKEAEGRERILIRQASKDRLCKNRSGKLRI